MPSLPRSTPAEQQVDARALLRVLDALESHPDVEMHSLMVVRHGHVVAEGWWAPYTPERPHLLYSVSKSFAMTAALLAQPRAQRWEGALHDVPLQWPALVSGLVRAAVDEVATAAGGAGSPA